MTIREFKESSFPVIGVIIKQHHSLILRNIYSVNMKESSILVTSVIIKLHIRPLLRDI